MNASGDTRPRKVVLCAEYQGRGATITATGFQIFVDLLIGELGLDETCEVVVYCTGDEQCTYPHPGSPRVIVRQYAALLCPQQILPDISPDRLPFRVELFPLRWTIVRDILRERPDVIHTFQTFGTTDLAGLTAGAILRSRGAPVRLVSSVITEIETYMAVFFRSFFWEGMLELNLRTSYRELFASVHRVLRQEPDWRWWRLPLIDVMLAIGFPLCRGLALAEHQTAQRRLQSAAMAEGRQLPPPNDPRVRWLVRAMRLQISWFLRQMDAVTVSRPEDRASYELPGERVWNLPLASNSQLFRPLAVTPAEARGAICEAAQRGEITQDACRVLSQFLEWLNEPDSAGRAFVSVGRLSEEKNVPLLADALRRTISRPAARRLRWLAVGSGDWSDRLHEALGDRVILTGLLPGKLLPILFGALRSRRAFFVSASDTETYGLAHEEAQRCGLPIVAMQRGTRGHFFLPGDSLGGQTVTVDAELPGIADAHAHASFEVAVNGLMIPDFSDGKGLNAVGSPDALGRACSSLAAALEAMAGLSEAAWRRMSDRAREFTERSKPDVRLIRRMLSEGVYQNDSRRFDELSATATHRFRA